MPQKTPAPRLTRRPLRTKRVRERQNRALALPLQPGALSQPRPLPKALEFLDAVEKQVTRAKTFDDMKVIVAALDNMGRLSSHSLAWALHTIEATWNTTWGDFDDEVFAGLGYDVDTCKRYLKAGNFMASIPNKPLKESFLERPISDLIALGQAREEHGDFTVAQLKVLANATDGADLREKIGKAVKRKERKTGGLIFQVAKDGTLMVWQKGVGEVIGYLNEPGDLSDLASRGRASLIKRGKIKEK